MREWWWLENGRFPPLRTQHGRSLIYPCAGLLGGETAVPPTPHSTLRTQHGRFPQFCQAINGKKIIPLPILELAGISFREYKIPLAVAVHLNGVAHPEYSFCFWLQ